MKDLNKQQHAGRANRPAAVQCTHVKQRVDIGLARAWFIAFVCNAMLIVLLSITPASMAIADDHARTRAEAIEIAKKRSNNAKVLSVTKKKNKNGVSIFAVKTISNGRVKVYRIKEIPGS